MTQNHKATNYYEIKESTEPGFSKDTGFDFDDKVVKTTLYERDKNLDYYFESYSHFSIHEEMLKDEIRTYAYMRAIVKNKHLFKDKIVMDVGSGTGILSMFAAQAGAKHVYACDFANIVDKSRLIVEQNGLSDKITCIRGKIEEIELPEGTKIDIIISEWMGYFLQYEGMLDSVIFARDKWLVEGGLIFPDRAVMFMAGIEDEKFLENRYKYWDNVYGFRMSCAQNGNKHEPLVDTINKEAINTTSCPIFEIDQKTCTVADLDFASCFDMKALRDDVLNGFVGWFECFFTDCHILERLDTSPFAKYTHWKQSMFYFDEHLIVKKNDTITGNIAVRKNVRNPRDLDIKIWASVVDKRSKNRTSTNKYFIMH